VFIKAAHSIFVLQLSRALSIANPAQTPPAVIKYYASYLEEASPKQTKKLRNRISVLRFQLIPDLGIKPGVNEQSSKAW